nr:RICIN domain-containing protein [Nostoc sp. WHI]
MEEITSPSTLPTAGKDYYLIAKHSDKALSVDGEKIENGANVIQYQKTGSNNSKWHLEDAGEGYFYLIAKHSSKALNVSGGEFTDGANVIQWAKTSDNNEKWKFEDAGEGYFYLIAKHSGKALAVYGGVKTDGTNVIQWTNQKVDHFKWKFEVVPIQEGKFYRLTTKWLGDGQSLDLDGSTKQPRIADTGDYLGQYWKFTSVSDGYYRLTTAWLGSEKSLDLNASTKQPTIADTGDYLGQYWKITPIDSSGYEDYYRLTTKSLGDGQSLDLNPSTKQPTIADTGDYLGQYWKFTEVPYSVVPIAPPPSSTSNTSTPATPISDKGTIATEAGKTYKVQITVNVPANIGYNNSFGIFAINDDGSTAGVKPGDPDYAATVVKNRIPLPNADQGSYQKGQTFQYKLPGGPKYSVFLIANGTPALFLEKNPKNEGSKPPLAYFFNTGANPDGKSHVKVISPNEYGFEDIYGGGDQDFDDLIVKLETLSVE